MTKSTFRVWCQRYESTRKPVGLPIRYLYYIWQEGHTHTQRHGHTYDNETILKILCSKKVNEMALYGSVTVWHWTYAKHTYIYTPVYINNKLSYYWFLILGPTRSKTILQKRIRYLHSTWLILVEISNEKLNGTDYYQPEYRERSGQNRCCVTLYLDTTVGSQSSIEFFSKRLSASLVMAFRNECFKDPRTTWQT